MRVLQRPILNAFVGLFLGGCSGRISKAMECVDMTQARLEAGNLREARRNLRRALVARDDVSEYLVRLVWVHRKEGCQVSAFDSSSMALKLKRGLCTVM
jgi:hypothetical protein